MSGTKWAGLAAVALGLGWASGASAADVKAGGAIYAKQCVICHGKTGAGDGPTAANFKEKPGNWTAGGLKDMDDAKIAEITRKGGKALGKSAAMPAYPKLSDAEVADLVAYVKSIAK
jgi:mono/diheme cytochrome c family protein